MAGLLLFNMTSRHFLTWTSNSKRQLASVMHIYTLEFFFISSVINSCASLCGSVEVFFSTLDNLSNQKKNRIFCVQANIYTIRKTYSKKFKENSNMVENFGKQCAEKRRKCVLEAC